MLDNLNTLEIVGVTILLMIALYEGARYVRHLVNRIRVRRRIRRVLRQMADEVAAEMSAVVEAAAAEEAGRHAARRAAPAARVSAAEHHGTTRLTLSGTRHDRLVH